MAKVFKAMFDVAEHPNRVNHDLSHHVLGTYGIGKLYPVFCQEVVPGDSFLVDSAAQFNFMPLNYPTPSRMRVVFNWFYQRTKNVWPNFENFVEGLEEHVHPYIEQPASFYKTGSLADHLGIPSTLASHSSESLGLRAYATENGVIPTGFSSAGLLSESEFVEGRGIFSPILASPMLNYTLFDSLPLAVPDYACYLFTNPFRTYPELSPNSDRFIFRFSTLGAEVVDLSNDNKPRMAFFLGSSPETATLISELPIVDVDDSDFVATQNNVVYKCSVPIPHFGDSRYDPFLQTDDGLYVYMVLLIPIAVKSRLPIVSASVSNPSDRIRDISDGVYSPYYNASNTEDTIRINALPFRVYESIYNAFYRNTLGNQPFMINGEVKYNRYNTTLEDGADSTDYHLFNRNWELDPYTSGLPSPQQGPAPVVGVNALGDIQVTDENGIVSTFSATADGQEVSVMSTNPNASVENSRVVMRMLESGFIINDFRAANAYQRFKEVFMRTGYRYKDFIKGHFGVSPKHSTMDMPEFLGGYSVDVQVGKVTSLAETSEGALGEYRGEASAFGRTDHKLKHMFDDYGYLMCIMCIVPEPSYSQLLPKTFMKRERLDYYFHEFSQLGMQPVTYEEVCPIQSHNEYMAGATTKKLTDTFCYQRPNHDMVFIPNSIHGLFRTDLNDYIINRVFTDRPELGNDFLTIKNEETNSIFQYTDGDDVMVGKIGFKIAAKRPVPYVVVPSLGR